MPPASASTLGYASELPAVPKRTASSIVRPPAPTVTAGALETLMSNWVVPPAARPAVGRSVSMARPGSATVMPAPWKISLPVVLSARAATPLTGPWKVISAPPLLKSDVGWLTVTPPL